MVNLVDGTTTVNCANRNKRCFMRLRLIWSVFFFPLLIRFFFIYLFLCRACLAVLPGGSPVCKLACKWRWWMLIRGSCFFFFCKWFGLWIRRYWVQFDETSKRCLWSSHYTDWESQNYKTRGHIRYWLARSRAAVCMLVCRIIEALVALEISWHLLLPHAQ